MNLWRAFWKCRDGRHDMHWHRDQAVTICSQCGVRLSDAYIQEVVHGHRQDRKNPGSVAGTIPTGTSGERAGGAVIPSPAGGDASPRPEPIAQEIIGWRGWNWLHEPDAFGGWSLALQGFRGRTWEGPTFIADQLPEASNENGIYARPMDWYQKMMSNRYYMFGFGSGAHPSPVQGTVALSGRVIQGEHGWRAERGTIRELWVMGAVPVPELFVRAHLEDRYGCDIHWGEIPDKIFPGWLYA